jgi:hypothetical protein
MRSHQFKLVSGAFHGNRRIDRPDGARRTATEAMESLEPRTFMSAGPSTAFDNPPCDRPAAVYAAHSTVRGKTLNQWSAQWWQWLFSQQVSNSALFDDTGAKARLGDVDGAFFIGGAFNATGTATRTITLPSGKPVFFPVLNVEWDNAGEDPPVTTVEELRANAAVTAESATVLHTTIDGQAVPDLFSHREISPVFSYTLPATDNLYQFFGLDVSGKVSLAVSDGYWLMLKPLSLGHHDINFGGTFGNPAFSLDITYHIDVVPNGLYEHDNSPPSGTDQHCTGAPSISWAKGLHRRGDLHAAILNGTSGSVL